MADAEGRLMRRPGIVALHSGPGSLNAMISLANAAKDCSPVIAITGSIKRRLQGCDGMLELDHVRVFHPICRAAFRIDDVRNIPTIFTQAWDAAMSGPRGPVLIEVPEDVLGRPRRHRRRFVQPHGPATGAGRRRQDSAHS